MEVLLDKWINKILIAAVFAVPLFFLPNVETAFTVPRATLLWISVFTILGLILLKKEKWTLPSNKIIFTYLAIAFLSTIFSISPPKSLLGERTRYEGLITTISYMILFYLGLNSDIKLNRVIKILAVASIPISIYGLTQFFGKDFFAWGGADWSGNRSSSTIGQPNVLGTYFALVLPLFAGEFFKNRSRPVLYGLAGSLGFICLLTSFTRGAWVGAAISAAILGSGLRHLRIKISNAKLFFMAFFILISAISFLIIAPAVSTKKSTIPQEKIANTIAEGIPRARLAMWNGSIKIAKNYPLLGSGLDSFATVFPQFRTLQDAQADPDWDETHPHNQFMDTVASSGLLGLSALFWILILAFYNLKRAVTKDAKGSLTPLALIASMIGFVVSIQSEISSVSVMPIFWLIAGISCGYTGDNPENNLSIKPISVFDSTGRVRFRRACAILVFLLIPFLLLPYFSEIFYWKGLNLSDSAALRKAEKTNPLEEQYPITLSKDYTRKQNFGAAFNELAIAKSVNPLSWKSYFEIGDIYLAKNSRDYLISAKMSFEQAKKLNPYSQEIALRLGRVLLDLGQINQAKEVLENSKSVNRGKDVLLLLVKCYEILGQKTKYTSVVKDAFYMYPEDVNIRNLYFQVQNSQ